MNKLQALNKMLGAILAYGPSLKKKKAGKIKKMKRHKMEKK